MTRSQNVTQALSPTNVSHITKPAVNGASWQESEDPIDACMYCRRIPLVVGDFIEVIG